MKKSKETTQVEASELKTYDDLRERTLALVQPHRGSWSEWIVDRHLLKWSHDASDERVQHWLSFLDDAYQSRGAALVALQRLRNKQDASAKAFLSFAESKYDAESSYHHRYALPALVAAWWRLAHTQKAADGFALLAKRDEPEQSLAYAAGLGGHYVELDSVLARLFSHESRCDVIVPAMMSALDDGEIDVFEKVMKAAAAVLGGRRDPSDVLSGALLERFRADPGRYMDCLLRYPQLIADLGAGRVAFRALELHDSQQAVTVAKQLIAREEINSTLRLDALAVLAAHSPSDAATWADDRLPKIRDGWRASYLAAVGQNDEARGALSAIRDRYEAEAVAQVTTDAKLAADALEIAVERERDARGYNLVPLVDLGERAWVDAYLERTMAAIAALPPKDRDLRCRELAGAAAEVGRPDLAFAAAKLPTNAMRRYSANRMVMGFSSVGVFTSALAAMELVPDKDANGRASTALQSGLGAFERAAIEGPRAVVVRALIGGLV